MAKALILVDIQNDYFPGGKVELVGTERFIRNAVILLTHCRQKAIPVFHIQHVSTRPGATAFLAGTAGVGIHSAVAPMAGECVIQKHYPNSFRDTTLYEQLKSRGIDELILCGAMSHMCIDATTRAAFDMGFSCTVIEDACTTRDLQFQDRLVEAGDVHTAFMAALAYIYAKVVSIDQVTQ